jgi:hypothetical protein
VKLFRKRVAENMEKEKNMENGNLAKDIYALLKYPDAYKNLKYFNFSKEIIIEMLKKIKIKNFKKFSCDIQKIKEIEAYFGDDKFDDFKFFKNYICDYFLETMQYFNGVYLNLP